jgi:hypothetical protein
LKKPPCKGGFFKSKFFTIEEDLGMKTKAKLILQLLAWKFNKRMTIRDSRKNIVCPVMLRQWRRFKEEILLCDIPETRAVSIAQTGERCTNGSECFPRKQYADVASDELVRWHSKNLK